jgi:hypothetical protein
MSQSRRPANPEADKPQPHEVCADPHQPYSKEHEEYSGVAVVKPPEKGGDAGHRGRDRQNPPRQR